MLHIGDRVEHLDKQRDYIVSAIYAGHAVADGITNPNDQIGIPIDSSTYEITVERGYKVVDCPHDTPATKSASYAGDRSDAAFYNVGALDSLVRELSWVLRNLAVNAGATSERKLYEEASRGVKRIRETYSILKPMPKNSGNGDMLSHKELPPAV
jgi:hypothetical protein